MYYEYSKTVDVRIFFIEGNVMPACCLDTTELLNSMHLTVQLDDDTELSRECSLSEHVF